MLTGIVGGGLSGLALQHFLSSESEVLEKEDRPGGLCRTFNRDGFDYDIGGHILFSSDPGFMESTASALAGNLNRRRRANSVLYKGRYVKYPFENGLGALDREDVYDCLIGYLLNEHPEPSNFREWILNVFGDGIAEKYLLPYNEKIWKVPLEEIGLEWVERVPRPPLEDIVRSALGIETEGYLHQLNFLYPARGGIEAFARSFIDDGARVIGGFEARSISKKGSGWVVSDGDRQRSYDRVVLTCPLTGAVRLLEDVPREVRAAAAGLRHNAVRVVLVGVGNESLTDRSAVYIPDPSVLAHRVCFMSYFSRESAPRGCSSLIAEITAAPGGDLYGADPSSIIERTVKDLDRIGIVDAGDVVATDEVTLEHAYVVLDLDHAKNAATVRGYLESLGLHALGRFGQWEYINMDEAVRRSALLAASLDGGGAALPGS